MRYGDWQSRFWSEMSRQQKEPFRWGHRDCVLSAAMFADAISDQRYVERARQSFAWETAREAAQVLASASLRALVETVMGPMLSWVWLGMGDLALVVDDNERQSLAAHDGVQVLGPVENGMQVIPFRYVMGGWHVT